MFTRLHTNGFDQNDGQRFFYKTFSLVMITELALKFCQSYKVAKISLFMMRLKHHL